MNRRGPSTTGPDATNTSPGRPEGTRPSFAARSCGETIGPLCVKEVSLRMIPRVPALAGHCLRCVVSKLSQANDDSRRVDDLGQQSAIYLTAADSRQRDCRPLAALGLSRVGHDFPEYVASSISGLSTITYPASRADRCEMKRLRPRSVPPTH